MRRGRIGVRTRLLIAVVVAGVMGGAATAGIYAMGMRGTGTEAFLVTGKGSTAQILPAPFADMQAGQAAINPPPPMPMPMPAPNPPARNR